jgi:hypothetical protein
VRWEGARVGRAFRCRERFNLPRDDDFGCYVVRVPLKPVESFFDALNLCGAFFRVAGSRAERWRMGLRLHNFGSV